MTDFACETLPGPPVGEITRMVERRNRGLALVEQAVELAEESSPDEPLCSWPAPKGHHSGAS